MRSTIKSETLSSPLVHQNLGMTSVHPSQDSHYCPSVHVEYDTGCGIDRQREPRTYSHVRLFGTQDVHIHSSFHQLEEDSRSVDAKSRETCRKVPSKSRTFSGGFREEGTGTGIVLPTEQPMELEGNFFSSPHHRWDDTGREFSFRTISREIVYAKKPWRSQLCAQ